MQKPAGHAPHAAWLVSAGPPAEKVPAAHAVAAAWPARQKWPAEHGTCVELAAVGFGQK